MASIVFMHLRTTSSWHLFYTPPNVFDNFSISVASNLFTLALPAGLVDAQEQVRGLTTEPKSIEQALREGVEIVRLKKKQSVDTLP
jgi:hypothetical protein